VSKVKVRGVSAGVRQSGVLSTSMFADGLTSTERQSCVTISTEN